MADNLDLLSHPTRPEQLNMFVEMADRTEPASVVPDVALIRGRLDALLASARGARLMPWSERDARMWQTVVPQMADWLPAAEANHFCLAFAQEMRRLNSAPSPGDECQPPRDSSALSGLATYDRQSS